VGTPAKLAFQQLQALCVEGQPEPDKCYNWKTRSRKGNHMTRIFLAVASMLATVGVASAQYPGGPMDMSGMINRQIGLGIYGDQVARYYGMQCYNQLRALRASGYYGPADCGTNASTLQDSITRSQGAFQNYMNSQWYHGTVMGHAYDNYSRALTGQPLQYHTCLYGGQYVRC
jgi:hypothetical protein